MQNSRIVLKLVRQYATCSKADLARRSGLSAPTVAAAITELADHGFVEYLGEGPSSGGRRPELLRFCPTHRIVAAVDIGGTRLRLMLADLNGATVAERKCLLAPSEKDPAAICRQIHELILGACADAVISPDKIVHLAVGAPGITDVKRGVVLSAPNLTGWTDVALQQMLEQLCGIPATIENDVNLAAIGEHWRGAAENVDQFIFIAMGTGIGAGIYLNGQLHHGAQWSAGEMGYLPASGMEREMPDAEALGQLERTIGGVGIERKWRELLLLSGQDGDRALMDLPATGIFDRVGAQQDLEAIAVLNYTARQLADAIVIAMLIVNPSLIVLGGGIGSHPCLQRETERLLGEARFSLPTVRTSTLGLHAQLYGAVALALEAVENQLVC
ncbi:ROK family transcriptional regulator [Telmatobacter bradus]|uniref:ROK family transcriptional regulator n=1 Tax=Telmatobacter bradus TaxID=474953 RepID=UPI003B42E34C